jgi:hypothetical protein
MAVTRLTAVPNEEELTTLPGNVHPLARAEFDRGAVPDELPMEHIIMMLQRTPDQEMALHARIDQMHNHQSPLFHKWLSTEQVGSCYGAADADIATISNWLQSKGFKVDSVPAGKTLLIFSGTAGQVRDAFHTEMHYLNVDGKQHIANMSAPQVPAAFASVIAGFRSLHDFFPKPTMRPLGMVKRDPKTGKTHLVDPKNASPLENLASKSKGSPNPDVYFSGDNDQDLGPQDFYTIYNESPLLNGTSCGGGACNGAGQSIGVIEETDVCGGQTGTSPDNCAGADDLGAFRSQFGLPAANINYLFGIPSYCSDPGVQGPNGTGEEGEADLDVQWSGAVAPGASLYYVACASTESSAGVDLAATYAVNNLASTLSSFSLSYGICESTLPAYGFGANSFYNALWEQAAAQGQTVVISSGDSGDDTCDRDAEGATSGWNVNGLASTPYDVATGGTDFSDNYSSGFGNLTAGGPYWNANGTSPYGSALSYIPETTWNGTCASTMLTGYIAFAFNKTYTPEGDCNSATPFGADFTSVGPAGGGGISSLYSIPTWQSVYGVGLSTNNSSSTMRNVPDVSMFASNGVWNHSLLLCESDAVSGTGGGTPCDYSATTEPEFMAAGGTSFVSPQINGLMALINQANPSGNPAQPTRQGQANYTFYALAAHEFGTPGAENVSTTAPSVLTCESNYLAIAAYSSVFPSCIFYDINRTPLINTQECSGTDGTSCIVDGNQMPCVTGDTDCFTATSGDTYGILSISTSSFEPAWYQSAGYNDAVGLGSVNIANLVANWNSSTWITQYGSSTALATSASSIVANSSVTLTATVTATGRGATVSPAGVVEFFIGSTAGTLLGSGPIVQTCTGSGASVSCDGVATLNVAGTSLSIGSNSIIAYFEGDGANDAPSTSASQGVTVTGSPAILQTPAPGLTTILGASNVAFTWSAGVAVTEYQLGIGTVAGGQDLFLYKGTATTATASSLPANGVEVYATLYSKIGGVWQSNAYVYTESGTPTAAVLQSPTPGLSTILGANNVLFTWSKGVDVTDYQFNLSAVKAGGSELYTYKGTLTSATVSSIPANGVTVYARLYSYLQGAWQYTDYQYTESGTPTPAVLQSPTPGLTTILGANNVLFQWSKGTDVADYELNLSAVAAGGSELYSYKGTALSATATSLPAKGVKVYARLYSLINGAWQFNDYQYTESGTATPAVLQSPTPGLTTILGTSGVVFTWSTGTDVADYELNLSAVAAGGSELYSYKGTAVSATATSLPAKGVKVYARLYSLINGAWQFNDYQYTESGTATPAVLQSPTPGLTTVLGTSGVVFTWSTGTDVTDYQLNLSAVKAGNSELYSYKGTATTATAPSIPANGATVYARLYSLISGTWQFNDYQYTEQ